MPTLVKPEQLLNRVPESAGDIFRMVGVKNASAAADQIRFNAEHVPFKFQVSALRQVLKHVRFGLYDETGCGKTLPCQLLMLLNCCLGNKGLVIMPPNLIGQFQETFESTFPGVNQRFYMAEMPKGPKVRTDQVEEWTRSGWPDVLMMSYQMFLKTWTVVRTAGYDAVVADEAQALKNTSATTSAAFSQFIGEYGDKYVMLMTGTPAHNDLTDLYGLIKLTFPEAYTNKRVFEKQHCVYVDINDRKTLVGFKGRKLLSENLYARGRRVRKEQVYNLDRPAVTEVPVTLGKAHMALYKKLMKERVLEMGDEIIDATNASSLRQKALRIIANPTEFTDKRIKNEIHETLDSLVDSFGPKGEKVMMVCNFQATVRALAERYKNLNPALAYGKSNTEKARKKFLNDESCRLIIIHPKSAGYGMNLQSVCRYVVFVEPLSVPGDFKQAMDRVHRPGQKKHVSVYLMRAEGTIAPHMTQMMLAKEYDNKIVARDKTSVTDTLFGGTVEATQQAA